jgi:hypothetical protein
VESAGIDMVESAGIDMLVVSAGIAPESAGMVSAGVAAVVESVEGSADMVESCAGAGAAAVEGSGAGVVSGSDLLQAPTRQAATNAETASVRVMRSLCG